MSLLSDIIRAFCFAALRHPSARLELRKDYTHAHYDARPICNHLRHTTVYLCRVGPTIEFQREECSSHAVCEGSGSWTGSKTHRRCD